MKKLLLLSLMACFTFANNLFAQEDFATISQGTGRLHVTTNDNRPRSLFPDSIECSYYAGELSFSSEIELVDINVCIVDESTGVALNYYITDIEQSIFVSLQQATYYIICRTKNGEQYEGVLTITV